MTAQASADQLGQDLLLQRHRSGGRDRRDDLPRQHVDAGVDPTRTGAVALLAEARQVLDAGGEEILGAISPEGAP